MKKLLTAIQTAGTICLFLAAGASDAGSLSLGWTAVAAAAGILAVAVGCMGRSRVHTPNASICTNLSKFRPSGVLALLSPHLRHRKTQTQRRTHRGKPLLPAMPPDTQ